MIRAKENEQPPLESTQYSGRVTVFCWAPKTVRLFGNALDAFAGRNVVLCPELLVNLCKAIDQEASRR
ncbi:hypothetical protein TYRP_014842 [Tyrophagus putrescentiae]|nr:hypothetical protein TYRP_014842 [Tyrophagus putrescentiae]